MTDQQKGSTKEQQAGGKGDEKTLAQKVAERVWELWREELRRERERRGGGHRR